MAAAISRHLYGDQNGDPVVAAFKHPTLTHLVSTFTLVVALGKPRLEACMCSECGHNNRVKAVDLKGWGGKGALCQRFNTMDPVDKDVGASGLDP